MNPIRGSKPNDDTANDNHTSHDTTIFPEYDTYSSGEHGYGGHSGSAIGALDTCLLYTSPSPRDQRGSRMPSSA